MTFCALFAAAKIGGVFPLLCTPYSEDGSLDCETLAKEASFVADCGADGIIWPAANDAIKWLSPEEERRGVEAIAAALDGRDVWFSPCCPGTNAVDMLRRVGVVNEVAARHPRLRMTMLVRMLDDAKCDADYERQYDALASATKLPVIIQTYNGKSPQQSVASIVALAKEFPQVYGWVKEESPGGLVNGRMAELVAAKPAIKTVFSGWGAKGWLYQGRRIGTEGVVTQRAPYADLLVYIWKRIENGDADHTLTDAYSKLLLMYNIGDTFGKGSDDMRGPHLYVLQRRGIFTNRLTRVKAKGAKDKKWEMKDVPLSDLEKAEIDARLEALKPYLYKGEIAPRD